MVKKTWIGPETDAYNTYDGSHSNSNRRGEVLWPDGKVRMVTLGVADTYFTIPAHGRYRGRYVAGSVSQEDGEFQFTPTNRMIREALKCLAGEPADDAWFVSEWGKSPREALAGRGGGQ